MALIKKQISLPASATYWSSRTILSSGTNYNKEVDRYYIPVQKTNASSGDGEEISYAVYEWVFTSSVLTAINLDYSYFSHISKIEIEFYYRKANDGRPIDYLEFTSVLSPGGSTATNLWSAVHDGVAIQETLLQENRKSSKTITISENSDDSIVETLADCFKNGGSFSIGIRRKIIDEQKDGYVELGGKSMLNELDSEWRKASDEEPNYSPRLVFTYNYEPKEQISHEMRYTTSDPTVTQSTPSNSIGGYVATNQVYDRVYLGDYFNSTQTYLSIDSSDSLPDFSGLLQVGPEILRFTETDSSSNQIQGITRDIITGTGFPSSLDPTPEPIHYLKLDRLFDNKPKDKSTQYRCVAILNSSQFKSKNIRITLLQNSETTTIDVGIEVPKFESKTASLSTTVAEGSNIITSVSDSVINKQTGYFNGAHVVIDPSGSSINAFVESYDYNNGVAEFILDRSLSSTVSGTTFRINPAPSQIIGNESQVPTENSGLFLGFLSEGGSNSLNFDNIHENQGNLNQYDVFYLWIKRTLKLNSNSSASTGAILIIRFVDSSAET